MEIVRERLQNWFLDNSNNHNQITLVMAHIVSNPDEFVLNFYMPILQNKNEHIIKLADIFCVSYLGLRSIFLHSALLNIPYHNSKPNTHMILGEDINLLGSMTIIVEMNNELLKFISMYFPQKLGNLDEILDKTINTKIIEVFDNSVEHNFLNIQNNILENFNFIVDWLLR